MNIEYFIFLQELRVALAGRAKPLSHRGAQKTHSSPDVSEVKPGEMSLHALIRKCYICLAWCVWGWDGTRWGGHVAAQACCRFQSEVPECHR